jgi:phosphatidylglycerol:prolipoprotein diacylglycerol transferase
MLSFLHNYQPQAIIFSWGPYINIHWYGLFIVLGIAVALYISLKLSAAYGLSKDNLYDLSFWLIINGLLGARIYDVFLEFSYYLNNPWQVLAIWRGGLAIHGALIAGLLTIIYFSRRFKVSLFKISACLLPGLAFGQAIGRFGNYFNQELFGLPTNLPWGIAIEITKRPETYAAYQYFHPTFLYESLGCLFIGLILLFINRRQLSGVKAEKYLEIKSFSFYFIAYSLLRFSLEFIRIDYAPEVFGWRWPQITSLLIIAIVLLNDFLIYQHDKKENKQRS